MKRILTAVVAVLLVAVAGAALAASSTNITVTANVQGTCKFTTGTYTLAFGDLDPALNTSVTKTGNVQFWCTKGSAAIPTFAAGDGSHYSGGTRNMQGPGSDLIPYVIDSFTADTNANLGPGTPRTVTIQGTIPANSYGDKSFGAYSDTVSITITP